MPYKDPVKQKAAQRMHYERNKALFSSRTRDRRNKTRVFILNYKIENNICTDCEISYPPHILQFDHLRDKSFQISTKGIKDKSIDQIKEEIEKCQIVCANCHSHRTYMRSVNQPRAGTKRIELSSQA
jgi:hypothetical protein